MSNIKAVKKGKSVEYLKFCVECGQLFTSKRSDKMTCSNSCRQRATRKKQRLEPFLFENRGITPEELKRFGYNKKNSTTID